jgi:hypothetical protein
VAKDFNTQDVSNDFLRLSIQIRMYQRYIIIAGDYITKGREAFLDALNSDCVR